MADPLAAQLKALASMHFVGFSKLDQLQGKRGVLVLGLMGHGKSTAIALQQGGERRVENGRIQIVGTRVYTPQVSHGKVSKTFNINVYPDPVNGLEYFDTAGLDEHRSPQMRRWTRFSLASAFTLLSEISCTLVVIKYSECFGRGEGFRKLATSLTEVVGDKSCSDHFYKSMAFVITTPYDGPTLITKDKLLQEVKDFQKDELQTAELKLGSLRAKYPASSPADMAPLALANAALELAQRFSPAAPSAMHDGGSMSKLAQHLQGIDFEKLRKLKEPDDDYKDFLQVKSALALLDALEQAFTTGQVCLSYPIDAKTSKGVRDEVNGMIGRSRPITATQLQQIAESMHVDHVDTWNQLQTVAGAFTRSGEGFSVPVKRLAELHEKLRKAVNGQSATLKAINGDWGAVKEGRQNMKTDELRSKKRLILDIQAQIMSLDSKTHNEEIGRRKVREERAGWGWWVIGFQYGHGGAWYNDMWFSSFDIHGNNYVKREEKLKGQPGRYDSAWHEFRSHNGHDLSVDVVYYRMAKDTEATALRRKHLQSDLDSGRRDQERLERELEELLGVQSREDMIENVTRGETTLKEEIKKITEKLGEAIPKCPALKSTGEPPLAIHVVTQLAKLLKALREAGAEPEGLGEAARASLDEFMEGYTSYQQELSELEKDSLTRDVLGEGRIVLPIHASPDHQEGAPPQRYTYSFETMHLQAHECLGGLRAAAEKATPHVRSVAATVYNHVSLRPCPAGVALVTAACAPVHGCVPTVMLSAGAYAIAVDFRNFIQRAAERSRHVLVELQDDLHRIGTGANAHLQEAVGLVNRRLEQLDAPAGGSNMCSIVSSAMNLLRAVRSST